MPAKAPLDVDLEDKLVYGLTPMRFAYFVVALLAAFSIWSSHWAPLSIRVVVAAFVIVIGAVAAWGRWRGRATDGWLTDMAIFVLANYRIEWTLSLTWVRWRRRPRKDASHEPLDEALPAAA
jgi:hypothetical protein